MIFIHNKRNYKGKGIYVGRPSVLGNPFRAGRDGTRDYVVDVLYRNWLWEQIKTNPIVYNELERLAEIARKGDLHLICWCFPLNCHVNIIKSAIEWLNNKLWCG
jgi:hypothetical protein